MNSNIIIPLKQIEQHPHTDEINSRTDSNDASMHTCSNGLPCPAFKLKPRFVKSRSCAISQRNLISSS